MPLTLNLPNGVLTAGQAVVALLIGADGASLASSANPIASTQKPSAASSGLIASKVEAAASVNATSVKAAAGQVYSIQLTNNAAYAVFVKFYNKASAPTVGTDVPVRKIQINAGASFSQASTQGLPFSTGIAYAITKLLADSDTTVVVAGDVVGTIDYI